MKRSFVFFTAVVALGCTATGFLSGQAAAQQAVAQSLFNLFGDGDSVDLNSDGLAQLAAAIRKAQVPRECPLGELTIYTPKGDPLFQQALSAARRGAVLSVLERQGLNVAGRLFVQEQLETSVGKFDTGYSPPTPDKMRPTLHTSSQPVKGSKVKPGQAIVVTMLARDDADRWQTGIQSIRLIAESDGGRNVAPTPISFAPCSDPPEKRMVVTYTVPADPPPVVRLRAVARDHTGLEDFDIGIFPTGDWYGTLEWSADQRVPTGMQHFSGQIDLALNNDGKGGFTGAALGTQSQRLRYQGCPNSDTVTPGRFRARLTASLATKPDTMSIDVSEPAFTPPQVTPCPKGTPGTAGSIHEWPGFREALRNLRRTDTDVVQSKSEGTIPNGTVRYIITLRRTQ